MENLIEQLNNYSKYGIPKSQDCPDYPQGQCPSIDALYKLEDDWRDIVDFTGKCNYTLFIVISQVLIREIVLGFRLFIRLCGEPISLSACKLQTSIKFSLLVCCRWVDESLN